MAAKQHSLLVIDDEENMRHMLQSLLHGHEYSVRDGRERREALRLVEQHTFDYILCDIRMPEMDGMTFLQSAKPIPSPVQRHHDVRLRQH